MPTRIVGNGKTPDVANRAVDWTYFLLVVQTVVNIISKPPIKIAIANPPATQFSHSVFSMIQGSL
jgi:hypothetical protein